MSSPCEDLQECRQNETGVENPANKRADAHATPTLRNHWGVRERRRVSSPPLFPPGRVLTLKHPGGYSQDVRGSMSVIAVNNSYLQFRFDADRICLI